jgi:hypothetical protein
LAHVAKRTEGAVPPALRNYIQIISGEIGGREFAKEEELNLGHTMHGSNADQLMSVRLPGLNSKELRAQLQESEIQVSARGFFTPECFWSKDVHSSISLTNDHWYQ